jgi:hypothetical protein
MTEQEIRTDTDDTEGHGRKFPGGPQVDGDDTEGNAYRGGITDGVEDDTEGHGSKFPGPQVDADDTEGNAAKSGH